MTKITAADLTFMESTTLARIVADAVAELAARGETHLLDAAQAARLSDGGEE